MTLTLADTLKTIQHGTPEALDDFVHNDNWYVRLQVAEHGTDKQRQQLLTDPMISVRASVAFCGNPEQVTTLLRDTDSFVRQSAVRNENITTQQLIDALNDTSLEVVETARDELELRNVSLYMAKKKG